MTPIPNTVLARLLHRLAGAVCEHPGWFLYPQIGLALAGVLYTTQRLKLDMNREHLVGATLRQQRAYLQYPQGVPAGRRIGGGCAGRSAGAQSPVH